MSGGTSASLPSQAVNSVHQLTDTDPDHIVLEKDTYLVDENNQVIPIPAGTVAVLEHGGKADKAGRIDASASAGKVDVGDADVVPPPSAASVESDLQPPDSTSLDIVSPTAAAAVADGAVSAACEVAEATSTDPNPSISLSDMFVQEEEEVTMEENGSKDQDNIVSASVPVKESSQSPAKAGSKPGRKSGQRKRSKSQQMSEECPGNGGGEEPKQQKGSGIAATEKPSRVVEKLAARSSAVSPAAAAAISATGRPQRSTPRRSAYEMLHGSELKPPRRSATEHEHESSGGKVKKQKVSKSDAAEDDDQNQSEVTKGTVEQTSMQLTSQSSVGSEKPQCSIPVGDMDVSASEVSSPTCPSSSCAAATGTDEHESIHSFTSTVTSDSKEIKAGISQSHCSGKNEEKVSIDGVKKRGRPKKDTTSSTPAADDDMSKKKASRKVDSASKPSKVKSSQKGRKADDGGDIKVPGLPYYCFTKESGDCRGLDSDSDSVSSLADDLASDDVDWMRGRITELEREVQQLQGNSTTAQDKKSSSRSWQDVLAEFGGKPPEELDEKQLLTRYEQKLRIIDRELDERTAFLRVREGCIARRERRILEKESELGRRERELEHQRHLHGHIKLPADAGANSNPLSSSPTDSSSVANRNIALEKEVRLELRKQELDRQKNVLNDERKKLAEKERELVNREKAMVLDADLLSMASGFKSTTVESRAAELDHHNGGTTVEFSDDDDDDNFGSNSFSAFGATRGVPLSFGLDTVQRDSGDTEHRPETSRFWSSKDDDSDATGNKLMDSADEDLMRILRQKAAAASDDEREASEPKLPRLS